jgi:hypothetical protein
MTLIANGCTKMVRGSFQRGATNAGNSDPDRRQFFDPLGVVVQ